MAVGQIVYNLTDYDNKGVYWSTSTGGSLISSTDSNYETSRIDITKSIPEISSVDIKHLGIQAPPGTQFILAAGDIPKKCIMGNTGVFELEEENITNYSLYFLKSPIYEYDKDTSETYENEGKRLMEEANTDRSNNMTLLDPNSEEYWDNYMAIQETYINKYYTGKNVYLKGYNGIYVPMKDENGNLKTEELYDIIIDYVTK